MARLCTKACLHRRLDRLNSSSLWPPLTNLLALEAAVHSSTTNHTDISHCHQQSGLYLRLHLLRDGSSGGRVWGEAAQECAGEQGPHGGSWGDRMWATQELGFNRWLKSFLITFHYHNNFIGFKDIVIIDLDTIDVSNLNRQFLFQKQHVGKSKSACAREAALRFANKCTMWLFETSIWLPGLLLSVQFYRCTAPSWRTSTTESGSNSSTSWSTL